jgi:endo-1,4-beta-xylanase
VNLRSKTIIVSLAFLAALSSCAKPAKTAAKAAYLPRTDSLRAVAAAQGIDIGSAVNFKYLSTPAYAKTLGEEFSIVTAEDQMKWQYIHPQRNQYEWFFADGILDYAAGYGMKVRGHTLVWHSQLAPWVTAEAKTKEDILSIVETHCREIVSHYKGRIYKWDVVNEVIADDGTMRSSVFSVLSGNEFIDAALKAARAADPACLLYINDYSVEAVNPKSDALYVLCKDLLKRGIPLDGVGFQAHLDLDAMPAMDSVKANVERFAALGLRVDFTELDIRFPGPATPERLASQAGYYADIAKIVMATPGTDTIVLWGLDDGHSWIPRWRSGLGNALILDSAYKPKPAYFALVKAFSGQ